MTVKIASLVGLPHMSATMSSRDHPFNRSTRPLLMERKPHLLPKKKSTDGSLHGFNDFQDIISQQYQVKNTHIGYPYGSPPSPTVINSNDIFCSGDPTNLYSNYAMPGKIYSPTSNPASVISTSNNYCHPDYHLSNTSIKEINLRKYCVLPKRVDTPPPSVNNIREPIDGGGPFIFGVHSTNAFIDPHNNQRTVINPTKKYSEMDKSILKQSKCDTSSSSQETEKDSRLLVKEHKEAIKRNRKGKKANKEKKPPPTIKCVLVGDGAVGKTNLIVSYLENRFMREHIPTASDIYNAEVMVNDSPVHITLCDTAGQDTLDPLRELCYPDSDVFLLCFSVINPETFRSIKMKWAPKFTKTKVNLILVGTQSDLRSDIFVLNQLQMQREKPISFSDAWDLASSIGAKYIETSSFTKDKVKDLFDTAIWDALLPSHLPPTPPFWKKLFCLV